MVLTDSLLEDINTEVINQLITFFTFMQFGTDNTAAVRTDTQLGNQIGSTPSEQGAITSSSTTVDGKIFSTSANSEDLVEIGFDNILAGTTLKNRFIIINIAKRSHRQYTVKSINAIAVTQS